MQINVFDNSSYSYDNGNKVVTGIFVQKHYLRANCKESIIEEDNELKNKYNIKNLPNPKSIGKAAS